MKKRLTAAIVCVCVMLGMMYMPAVAATNFIGIAPMWENTSDITLALSYSSGTVKWNSTIVGEPNTTKITATFTLYKINANGTYTSLGTWDASSTTLRLTTSGSATGSAGTYKISVTAKVTRNGTTETVDNSFETALS